MASLTSQTLESCSLSEVCWKWCRIVSVWAVPPFPRNLRRAELQLPGNPPARKRAGPRSARRRVPADSRDPAACRRKSSALAAFLHRSNKLLTCGSRVHGKNLLTGFPQGDLSCFAAVVLQLSRCYSVSESVSLSSTHRIAAAGILSHFVA